MSATRTIVLFRAVGLDEAADIRAFGGFRPHPAGRSMQAKWFATSFDDAVSLGRMLQHKFGSSQPFVVVEVRLPETYRAGWYFEPRLDGIGPAHMIEQDELPAHTRHAQIVFHGEVTV